MRGEERDVMLNERGESRLGLVAGFVQGLAGPADDLGETAVLDEVEKLQLAADIMVDAGQAEAAGFGQVPHGCGLVAPLRISAGGNGEEMLETLVVGEHGPSERSFGPEARPPLPGGQA